MNNYSIRPVKPSDIDAIKTIIDVNEMFPSEMLDDMIAPFFNDPECPQLWLTIADEKPLGVAYCVPEQMTEGTWNLLLIAIDPQIQGKGLGSQLIKHVEQQLVDNGQRILLVETSGLPDFALTRQFYHNCQYDEQARIKDYYEDGDDKIVFWKRLAPLKT